MPSSVNLLIPPKNASKKPKGETKSLVTKERKTQAQDIAMVEVPAKRETPKKEKKKFKSARRKEAPKKSSRRKKAVAGPSDLNEVPTASVRDSKNKKTAIPANADERSIDKKKDDVSKAETKSTASKTPSTSSKQVNLEMAQKFFKQMMESQRVKTRTREEDSFLETMPESSQVSTKSRKHRNRRRKPIPLDRNIFKENGEPVWIVSDRKAGEVVVNEDGELVKFPELMAALEEDGLEMEDGKGWFQKMSSYFMGELNKGRIDDKPTSQDLDPFSPLESLEQRTEPYFSKDAITYNTTDSIFNLCHNAIQRFSQQGEDTCVRRNVPPLRGSDSKTKTNSKDEEEKTCIVTSIRFNVATTFCISYDRRRPITSIQKFCKKYREQLKLSVEREDREKSEVHVKKEGKKEEE